MRKTIQRTAFSLICFAGSLGSGGCGKDYFVCTQDAECSQSAGGRCEPSGACSFPDSQCPTGRRYGEQGNPQIAGNCVPESDIGSTGVVETDGGTASSTMQVGSSDTSGTSTETGAGPQTGSTGGHASTGGASSSSTGGDSSSSTGEPIPIRELFQPCTSETQAVDCPNSACLELLGDIRSGFCSQPCRDVAECYDPGTGADPACILSNVKGTAGGSCALECSESGSAGCPDGMSCSPMAQLPDGSNVRLCYYS
ncbi:MAG: hypothetical protein ACRBN8_31825 [Nannocystales bacterium]